ncbi:MAG: HAMP domain-containing protein [Candidatus Omnitrophota bacterium]
MKTSLQARLIILMALGSIFLISAFTAIQVSNQMHQAREFSIFKAKEGAFAVMQGVTSIFSSAGPETPQQAIIADIKHLFSSLYEVGLFETAALLGKDGKPAILEGNLKLFFEEDRSFLEKLLQDNDESKWLLPVINKEHRVGSIFVIVENPYGYIAKLSFSLADLEEALVAVYRPVILTVVIVIIGNIILAALLSQAIITPIKLFNQATKDIASGNLDKKVTIKTDDELEELANTFNYMSEELIKMRSKAENANPLTKLPGNIVIQEEVDKKISGDKRFLLIYSDLDNFKAFNDKYGVEAGDRAIMLSAAIFKESLEKEGDTKNDFLGHEGGDDFLLLTVPERARKIADHIIREFDKRIRALYDEEDLARGYIEATSRDGDIRKFPIMTISLAGVGNTGRKIVSYAQLTNIAAEIKHKVKALEGSNFLVDRRTDDRGMAARGEN